MGWFGKKKTPQDRLEKAENMMNKGLTGMMMKGFVPKEHRNAINQSIEQAKQAQLAVTGALALAATAKVLSVRDTGKLINFDPVVILELDVTENDGNQYTKTLETLVSKLQIPRAGDIIGLAQHPANPSERVYMGPIS